MAAVTAKMLGNPKQTLESLVRLHGEGQPRAAGDMPASSEPMELARLRAENALLGTAHPARATYRRYIHLLRQGATIYRSTRIRSSSWSDLNHLVDHQWAAMKSIHTMSLTRRDLIGSTVVLATAPWATGWAETLPVGNAYLLVLSRLRDDYLATVKTNDAVNNLKSMRADGVWSDINYGDRSMGSWRPTRHLERLCAISAAIQTPKNPAFQSDQAIDAVTLGLKAWISRSPQSENWWHNTIGQQQALMPILVLLGDRLPGMVRNAAIGLLTDPATVPPDRATGQNLIWYAKQQIVRGALTGYEPDLLAARKRIGGTLQVTSDEGIQADFSFHQHGPQLYTGGYGLGFFQDTTMFAVLLANTPWALEIRQVSLLCDYVVKGVAPLVRGNWLDWGARGREFTRQVIPPRPRLVADAIKQLQQVAPSSQQSSLAVTFQRMSAGNDPETVVPYSTCYWRSDFVAHQTKAGYMSVKMCSSRTVGTESGNGENLLGYWMPFGATFFVQQGTEYDGLTAVWDWAAIPGVTAPQEVPVFSGYLRHNAQFVGCIGNGLSSLAAMRLNTANTTAKKAWFLHGDTMIALGADIQSKHPLSIRTTVNQTHWRGLLITDQGQASSAGTRTGLRWAWLNGVLYRMQGDTTAIARTEHVQSRSDLSNTAFGYTNGAAANTFTLQIDHGIQPTNGSYAYTVTQDVPDPTKVDLNPDAFTVISNSPTLQAVRWHDTALWMAVAHSPAELQLDSKRHLRLNRPCLLIVAQRGDTYALNVRMPGNSTTALLIELLENNVGKDSAKVAPNPSELKQGSDGNSLELKA